MPNIKPKDSLEYYFAHTGFYDLLPVALDLITMLNFNREEAIEAVCKVFDKARVYPPTVNRSAWFAAVFKEKLYESRAEMIAHGKY